MGLLNFLSLGLLGGFATSKSKKPDPYDALLNQINTYTQPQRDIANKEITSGQGDVTKALGNFDESLDYFKTLLHGSSDDLLKLFDATQLTKNIDDNVQNLTEFGVRGGKRASDISQASFNRDATINATLQSLRNAAPEQIDAIASQIANIGLQRIQSGLGINKEYTDVLFAIQQLKEHAKDRKYQLVGNILGAAGSAAGAIAGGIGGGGSGGNP